MIRQWNYVDLKKIEKFEKENFVDCWNYQMLADSFLNSMFFGFLQEENGEIVAIGSFLKSTNESDILSIVVKKDHRGKGLGKKMFDHLLKNAQENGIVVIFLEVRKSNDSAIALYKSCGFLEVGIRKNYYNNIEDAIVMKKTLIDFKGE